MEADISILRKTGHFYFALTRRAGLSGPGAGLGSGFVSDDLPGLELALSGLNFYGDLPCFTIPLLEQISNRGERA